MNWNISKDKKVKPTIEIIPVSLSGTTISFVTGFNAKYIVDNKIGKGSKLKIIRSGDVIPHIIDIIKETKAEMPKFKYKWTESKVDILVDDNNSEINKEILIKNITYFLKNIDIKNVDAKIIEKFIDSGLDTIPKILNAKKTDFLKVENFKETMATKIHDNIKEKIKSIELTKLMKASNIFGAGFGEKKLVLIVDKYPNITKTKLQESKIIEMIKEIDGFEEKTATKFAKNLPLFKDFLKTVPMIKIKPIVKKIGNKLKDIKIVFSGFRDKELEEKIVGQGGSVVGTISKNTNYLIVKSKDEQSSKIDKAKELKIQILTKKLNFLKKVLIKLV